LLRYSPLLEGIASSAINLYNLSSLNILISSFRTFKFLILNDRLNVLWSALDRAGVDVGGFLLIFFIMALGFLLTGIITFGLDTDTFNTFGAAFGSCWNFVIGNPPDYTSLFFSNRILGPLFFSLFTIFVFFVLVNMFIAILSEAYSDEKKSNKADKAKKDNPVYESMVGAVKGLLWQSSIQKLAKTLDTKVLENPYLTDDDLMQLLGPHANAENLRKLKQIHFQIHTAVGTKKKQSE